MNQDVELEQVMHIFKDQIEIICQKACQRRTASRTDQIDVLCMDQKIQCLLKGMLVDRLSGAADLVCIR